jgi:hypothetical protein
MFRGLIAARLGLACRFLVSGGRVDFASMTGRAAALLGSGETKTLQRRRNLTDWS